MEPLPIRVLVADERRIARDELVARLERTGLEVAGVASDATAAIEVARRVRPDVALIDVQLPGGAVRATEGIILAVEGCRVLALSADGERGAILQLLLAGAGGYLVKEMPGDELLAIVRRAAGSDAGLSVEVVTGLMGDLFREIADLSQMHERLRRSEERFRGLLEAAPDAVVIVDRQGEIVLVNQQTEMMFGYSRSELVGRPLECLVPERFHVQHIRHRLEYLAHPQTRRMGTGTRLAGRRMNGTEFPVDISLSTLETDGGTLLIAFVRELPRSVDEAEGIEVSVRLHDAFQELIDLTGAEAYPEHTRRSVTPTRPPEGD